MSCQVLGALKGHAVAGMKGHAVRRLGNAARVRGVLMIATGLLTWGCSPAVQPKPHYVLGSAYKVGSTWFYPRESYDLDQTGLAAILADHPQGLTTDGEVFDQSALAGASATLQLPAIARITNLENGRAVVVRINDRGPGDPHRLVEVTRRTAALLGFPADGVAQVRVQVLSAESHAAVSGLPGAPSLAIKAAPRGVVQAASLAPPPGIRQVVSATPSFADTGTATAGSGSAAPPLRLPETVVQTPPHPGRLFVRLDTFDEYQFARVQQARMAGSNAHIASVLKGRTEEFRVEIGPLANTAAADQMLDRALAAGIPDARIVVE